jgi:hypothetical protein
MKQLGSYWTDFHKIVYPSIFRKSVENIQISLKYDKNYGTLHEDQHIFLFIPRSFVLRVRTVSDNVVEKIKTHIIYSILLFFGNHPVYGIMWKNTVEPDRQVTVWRMRTECRIPKAIDTHSQYVMLAAFPQQQW